MNQQLHATFSEIPEYPYCGRFPQAKNVPVVRAQLKNNRDAFIWYCLYFDVLCLLVVLYVSFIAK